MNPQDPEPHSRDVCEDAGGQRQEACDILHQLLPLLRAQGAVGTEQRGSGMTEGAHAWSPQAPAGLGILSAGRSRIPVTQWPGSQGNGDQVLPQP